MTTNINNLTVISNLGNVLLKENIIGGGTQSTYIAQTIAFDRGAYTFVECELHNEQTAAAFENNPTHGTFSNARQADEAAFNFAVEMITELNSIFEAIADAANAILHTAIAIEADLQEETAEIAEAFAYDSRRPYSHVQVCELAGLPLQASVYLRTCSSGDHEAGNPLAVCVTDKCEFGYAHHTYLGFVSNWRNNGMYAAALTTEYENATILGNFKTTLEAQAALLRVVCDTIEAWAAAAHASLAIELTPTPENADTDFEYEALSAGRVFDAPASVLNKQYEIPAELSDIETLIDEIAADEYEDLQAIDKEIADLQARLLSLGSTRQDIVEEYAHWRGKCDRAIEIAEHAASYEANEADADLRQSIWFATGQDIM